MEQLKTLNLEKIDYNNKEHLKYLKELMESKDMDYLWNLTDGELENNTVSNGYIVINEFKESIGYLNLSNPTEAFYGRTVSLYYAVGERHRGNSYGTRIIKETMDWQFQKNNIDCIVAQVDSKNIHSQNACNKAGMSEIMSSEDYVTFIRKGK